MILLLLSFSIVYFFGSASAQKYLFSFGDSYTDTGFRITGAQPSPDDSLGNPAYGSYVPFTGGPNYIDFLTTEHNNSLVLSYNFAFGGATITDSIVPTSDPTINTFQQQVENYYQPKYSVQGGANAPWSADDAIFIIFFGINDIFGSYENKDIDPAVQIPKLLDAYFSYVDELHRTGARKFLFVGVPPVDRSPYIMARGAADAASCSNWVNSYNLRLAGSVNEWAAANPDSTKSIYDFHAWMTTVLDNPQASGFQDATCGGTGGPNCIWYGPNPAHTGSHFQELLSQNMLASLAVLGW
ncbi:hypothetical protein MMC28_008998 [Mycoblastus sanguinarius]|nr:hypothetical protein [Mycoblastus sanguinarius]